MEKTILKKGFNEYYVFDGMLSEINSVAENFLSIYRINEDYDTCEFYINGEKMEEVWKSEWETITKDYMDYMRTSENNEVDYFVWWFMTDYIGLKYQYHCDCCGDCVYSKTISMDEFFEMLPTVEYHLDEPSANVSAVPLYFLSKKFS